MTARNWNTKSTGTCRSGPRTTPENTGRRRTSTSAPTAGCTARSSSRLPKELERGRSAGGLPGSSPNGCAGKERLPYTLAIHRGGANGENPHAHLMFSERGHDGIERRRRAVVPALQRDRPRRREGRGNRGRPRPGTGWRRPVRRGSKTANRALERAGRGRADRRAQPGRSARRSVPGRGPGAGGGVEPGAERPSWPGAVQDEPGRGAGDIARDAWRP